MTDQQPTLAECIEVIADSRDGKSRFQVLIDGISFDWWVSDVTLKPDPHTVPTLTLTIPAKVVTSKHFMSEQK